MSLKVITKLIKKNKIESGQSLVQFVLVLPVLMIMFGIIVDTGRVINAKIILGNATAECIRYIVEKRTTPISDSNLKALTDEALNNGRFYDFFDKRKLNIGITVSNNSPQEYYYHKSDSDYYGTRGYVYTKDVQIELSYELDLIMPLARVAFKGNKIVLKNSLLTRVGYK